MKKPTIFANSAKLSVYVFIVFLATSSLLFGAQGMRYVTNFLGSGIAFVDQYSTSGTGANLGIATASLYASRNGTWFPFPGDNKNYIRGDSYLSGKLYDEQNTGYYIDPSTTSTLNQLTVSGSITGPTPTASGDLATKAYVDAASGAGGSGLPYYHCYKEINTSTLSFNPISCNSGYTSVGGAYFTLTGVIFTGLLAEAKWGQSTAVLWGNKIASLKFQLTNRTTPSGCTYNGYSGYSRGTEFAFSGTITTSLLDESAITHTIIYDENNLIYTSNQCNAISSGSPSYNSGFTICCK